MTPPWRHNGAHTFHFHTILIDKVHGQRKEAPIQASRWRWAEESSRAAGRVSMAYSVDSDDPASAGVGKNMTV